MLVHTIKVVGGGVTTHTMGRELGGGGSVHEVLPPCTGISDVSSVY